MHIRHLPNIDPDSREAKLPVWAQEILDNARRRVKDAEKEAEAARLATDPATSRAILDPHAAIPIGLGKNPKVTFVLSRRPDGDPLSYIEVRMSHDFPDKLELMASSTLHIRPQVTNVIQVWTTRD